ncbi:hypothetical protein [Ruminococcus flavefaciens]|uniref:Uncharacterized protein n=1 Tax=Ruminococcus flavefaciens TaxID=1265 RepID=A0A315XUX2_RUMFL|nr:hypothetical protein [Ruminococcus flavefaciens]PWJ10232.1 hypothetical protein IE37_03122 [Ruminococcus flavefaciens]SSA51972.1 hypothetical protein SAMN02910325_03122 [Ruminococcus flavefaciens]
MKFSLFKRGNLLSDPGDKFTAEVTKTGKQVASLIKGDKKTTWTRYPTTETVVETIVHKKKK